MDVSDIEGKLLCLMRGEFSSLTITFNDHCDCYRHAAAAIADGDYDHVDWVSDEEMERAIATNRVWVIRWYPNSPVGSCSAAASTLQACLAAAFHDGAMS